MDSNPSITRAEIWREAVAHLRYLNDEVWKRFQLFVWMDFALLWAIFEFGRHSWLLGLFMAVAGLLLTFVARYVLRRNRVYYLQMLLKKTLLEDELGFYQGKLSNSGTDLAFPWRVAPENLPLLKEKPEEWIRQNIRASGSIAIWLFVIYEVFIGIFGVIFLNFLF